MELLSLRCKHCGYPLKKEVSANKYICEACDTEFEILPGGNEKSDFVIVAGVLKKYIGASSIISIPEGVSIIGDECFMNMELLESISLPNGIIKIGNSAFQGCTRLKYVYFADSLSSIGDYAFKNSGIVDAILPMSLTHIGKDAFMGCQSLQKIKLPANPSITYSRTYKQCSSLIDVDADISCFCLSFKSSAEANKGNNTKSTLFDAFQATPYYSSLQAKQNNKQCIICGSPIGRKGICTSCGANHVDLSRGCYIATAVYGSYDCPQVWTLRRYRDNTLSKTILGRAFIRIYYAISPTLVKWFGEKRWFRRLWKPFLDHRVNKLNHIGVENTPYNDINW